MKTRSIESIERKMEATDASSMRYEVLKTAKSFKTSWIGLGQMLYSVWKDKMYKNWGFNTFDAYASKEIGIRKETALKLLRSYFFLEKTEPRYLKKEYAEKTDARTVPTCDAVNTLRLAVKKKGLDPEDYKRLKVSVLEKGKDAIQVKKDLTTLMKEREELDPEEARRKRKTTVVKRFISTLKSVNREARVSKMLPAEVLRDIEELIHRLESEIS